MCKTKSIVSLILVVIMLVTVALTAVSCNKKPVDEEVVNKNYTYKTYTSALGTNWNPHTWETNGDSSIMSYIETPLVDLSIKDSTTGEYQWIFLAATEITDVTAEHQDDLVKYGAQETDATAGYV